MFRRAVVPSRSGAVTSTVIVAAYYHNQGNLRKQTPIPS
jgi:hypothetical protein